MSSEKSLCGMTKWRQRDSRHSTAKINHTSHIITRAAEVHIRQQTTTTKCIVREAPNPLIVQNRRFCERGKRAKIWQHLSIPHPKHNNRKQKQNKQNHKHTKQVAVSVDAQLLTGTKKAIVAKTRFATDDASPQWSTQTLCKQQTWKTKQMKSNLPPSKRAITQTPQPKEMMEPHSDTKTSNWRTKPSQGGSTHVKQWYRCGYGRIHHVRETKGCRFSCSTESISHRNLSTAMTTSRETATMVKLRSKPL